MGKIEEIKKFVEKHGQPFYIQLEGVERERLTLMTEEGYGLTVMSDGIVGTDAPDAKIISVSEMFDGEEIIISKDDVSTVNFYYIDGEVDTVVC